MDPIYYSNPWDKTECQRLRRRVKAMMSAEAVATMHMSRKLAFAPVAISSVRASRTKRLIYVSNSPRYRQASRYYIDVVNGRLAYIRVSNHWGDFATVNETNDYEKRYKAFTWTLIDGNNTSHQSQAGLIFLEESGNAERSKDKDMEA